MERFVKFAIKFLDRGLEAAPGVAVDVVMLIGAVNITDAGVALRPQILHRFGDAGGDVELDRVGAVLKNLNYRKGRLLQIFADSRGREADQNHPACHAVIKQGRQMVVVLRVTTLNMKADVGFFAQGRDFGHDL